MTDECSITKLLLVSAYGEHDLYDLFRRARGRLFLVSALCTFSANASVHHAKFK